MVESESVEPPVLIPALQNHLSHGVQVFVRGKEAEIIEVDYPIVFWQELDSKVIKHRSFLSSPSIFQVVEGSTLFEDEQMSELTSAMDLTDSVLEEEFEIDCSNFDAEFPAFEDEDDDVSSAFDDVDPCPEVVEEEEEHVKVERMPSSRAALSANIMAAFDTKKKRKVVLSNEVGDSSDHKYMVVQADIPQAVHIESCLFLNVSIPSKVSNIALVDIDKMQLDFTSVISSLELLRADQMQIVCNDNCSMIKIESCHHVDIRIPETIPELKILCTDSTNVHVYVESDPSFPSAVEEEKDDGSSRKILDLSSELKVIGEVEDGDLTLMWHWDGSEKKIKPVPNHEATFLCVS